MENPQPKRVKPPMYKKDESRFTLSITRILDWFVWLNLNEEDDYTKIINPEKQIEAERRTREKLKRELREQND